MQELFATFNALKPIQKASIILVPLALFSCLCCCLPLSMTIRRQDERKQDQAKVFHDQERKDEEAKNQKAEAKRKRNWIKLELIKPLFRSNDIYADYLDNEVDAKERYQNRWMHVVITVQEVQPSGKGATVIGLAVVARNGRPMEFKNAFRCHFENADEVRGLRPDQAINMQAKCTGKGFLGIHFEECRVLPYTKEEVEAYKRQMIED